VYVYIYTYIYTYIYVCVTKQSVETAVNESRTAPGKFVGMAQALLEDVSRVTSSASKLNKPVVESDFEKV
jgi:hypothetical protein